MFCTTVMPFKYLGKKIVNISTYHIPWSFKNLVATGENGTFDFATLEAGGEKQDPPEAKLTHLLDEENLDSTTTEVQIIQAVVNWARREATRKNLDVSTPEAADSAVRTILLPNLLPKLRLLTLTLEEFQDGPGKANWLLEKEKLAILTCIKDQVPVTALLKKGIWPKHLCKSTEGRRVKRSVVRTPVEGAPVRIYPTAPVSKCMFQINKDIWVRSIVMEGQVTENDEPKQAENFLEHEEILVNISRFDGIENKKSQGVLGNLIGSKSYQIISVHNLSSFTHSKSLNYGDDSLIIDLPEPVSLPRNEANSMYEICLSHKDGGMRGHVQKSTKVQGGGVTFTFGSGCQGFEFDDWDYVKEIEFELA